MPTFKPIAKKSDIPTGAGKIIETDGKTIAIFNNNGEFYATDNTCPHQGGPLGDGICEENTVTCPWHGWQFNVATGENVFDPGMKLATYPLNIEGENILISL